MTRMERRKLREQEHKFKFVKINKRLVSVGLTTLVVLGIAGLSEGMEASADTWKATTVEEMKAKVKVEDGKYTFELGDTFYAIGEAINIKPAKLMELNNFPEGSQYSVPIGTTIFWSGDNVTVKDAQGNVIAQETIKSEDKIDPSKLVGGNSVNTTNTNGGNIKGNQNSSTNNSSNVKGEENTGSNNGGNGNNGGTTTPTPSNPEKPNPVDPNKPTEPEEPTPPTQSELEKLKAKLAELKAQLAQAKQELAQAEQELANAKSDTTKEEIQTKISEQQTIIDNAQATITAKQIEIASIDSQISVANTELSTAQNNLATANTALSQAQSNTATAQQAFDEANTALLADPTDPILQQKVTDTQSALNNAQAQETLAVNVQASAQTAVNTAQSTIDALNSSKQQATNELETAQNTLTTAQNEKSNLEQQLANLGNNNIPALEAKVKEKKKIVADLEAEIAKVEKKIAELENKEEPKPVQVDKTALSNLINSVKATDTSKFTDESVKVFNSALSTANSVLNNERATQEQVNSAVSNLQSAFNNLAEKSEENKVDKSALQNLINSVKDIDLSVYTDESVEKFNAALSTANSVLGNEKATQTQVDSALSNLQNAYDTLNFKPTETVNKNELSNLLDVMSKADLSKFTEGSVAKFNEALSNAYNVFWNEKSTQSEVDSAVLALETAHKNLEEKEDPTPTPTTDKTQLNLTVSEASSINLDNYTTETAKSLTTALSKAKQVLSDAEATQEQVNEAKQVLREAIDNLVKKADKKALDQAISKAPSAQGSYTDTSWKALQSALSEAKKVSGKEDVTQSEVDSATTALNKAINDLKVQKYTLTVIHKDQDGKVLDTETFEVEKGKNYSAKSKGFEGYALVGEGTKVVSNMQADGTVIFTYKKKVTEDEKIKETQDTVNKGAIDIWNDYREANGKTQAYENDILQKMADQRAKELVEIYDASHTRPNGYDIFGYNEKTGQWGESLAEEFGYYNVENMGVKRTVVGENIAKIEGVSLEWIQEHGATYVMEAWKASPAHNNMLLVSSANNPINQYGIGSHITKNSDGTYNVFYVALVGYDKNLK